MSRYVLSLKIECSNSTIERSLTNLLDGLHDECKRNSNLPMRWGINIKSKENMYDEFKDSGEVCSSSLLVVEDSIQRSVTSNYDVWYLKLTGEVNVYLLILEVVLKDSIDFVSKYINCSILSYKLIDSATNQIVDGRG